MTRERPDTLDVYTQAVNSNKRVAQSKVVRMIVSDVGQKAEEEYQKLAAGSLDLYRTAGCQVILRSMECPAGMAGLEPATSAATALRF